MDPSMRQIISELFRVSVALDQANARIAELEQAGKQQVAELQARIDALDSLPPGWRLVKDA